MSGEYFIAEDRGGELWVRAADVQSTISTLQAERDALRKDAERYRWIRRDRTEREDREIIDILVDTCEEYFDADIDAAIAAKEPKESEHAHDWRFSLQDHVYKCDCGATRGDYPYGAASFKD